MTDLPPMVPSAEDEEAILISFARKRNEVIADLENKIDALRAALDEAERTLITIRDVFHRCGGREQYDAVFREWGITALARIREVKRDG